MTQKERNEIDKIIRNQKKDRELLNKSINSSHGDEKNSTKFFNKVRRK